MSIFVPNKVYLRGILLHYFIPKKSAAEAHRILVQTYGDNALSDTTCRDWFRRFKNNDFGLEDKERSGAPKKFQDKELEQLLDEDPSQTLSELGKILQVDESTVSKRLKGLGMIQKQGHWVPYELFFSKNRILLVNHSPYSPDLAPCDFYLFGKLHLPMKGMRYADIPAIQKACTDILRAMPANDLKSSFEKLLSRANQSVSKRKETILNKIKQFCRKYHLLFLF
ncbi:MOS1T transposase, partial [Pseudoatta argentina]